MARCIRGYSESREKCPVSIQYKNRLVRLIQSKVDHDDRIWGYGIRQKGWASKGFLYTWVLSIAGGISAQYLVQEEVLDRILNNITLYKDQNDKKC